MSFSIGDILLFASMMLVRTWDSDSCSSKRLTSRDRFTGLILIFISGSSSKTLVAGIAELSLQLFNRHPCGVLQIVYGQANPPQPDRIGIIKQ